MRFFALSASRTTLGGKSLRLTLPVKLVDVAVSKDLEVVEEVAPIEAYRDRERRVVDLGVNMLEDI
jgi:hypothetical protein